MADQAMKAGIKQFDSAKEYYFDEGCFINEMSNSSDDSELSVVRARVAPGVGTRWHRLRGVTERYVITQGEGRVEVADLPPAMVGEGDVVIIPAGAPQRISNLGSDDLIFLAICVPPFTAEAYEDIEP